MTSPTKILFIVLDSVEPRLVDEWADEGVLPTLAALRKGAARGRVTNSPGVFVGSVWADFATGAGPGRHGRYWFKRVRSGSYEVGRSRPLEVEIEPFWSALSRAHRRVAVIDIPEVDPTPDLNGIHLVDWGTHHFDKLGFRTTPPWLAREVSARFGRDPVGACDRRRANADVAQLAALRADLLERVRRKEEMSRHFLRQGGWDLFLTLFSEAHCAGHQFWYLHDRRYPAGGRPVLPGDPLRDVYVGIDAALGNLLGEVGEETTVVVLCSHGMGPGFGGNFLLDKILRRLEQLPEPAERLQPVSLAVGLWQRLPSGVRKTLEPVRDRIVRRIDWSPYRLDPQRKCYSVPNNDGHGAIRINLRGREPNGIIEPGAEQDRFCRQLREDLLALTNADTGAPAVARVLRGSDFFDGPRANDLPDLLVEWKREARIQRLSSPKTGIVDGTDRQMRTGDHEPDGAFFVRGPGVVSGEVGAASISDFAPSVASLLGGSLGEADGRPIPVLTGARAK